MLASFLLYKKALSEHFRTKNMLKKQKKFYLLTLVVKVSNNLV